MRYPNMKIPSHKNSSDEATKTKIRKNEQIPERIRFLERNVQRVKQKYKNCNMIRHNSFHEHSRAYDLGNSSINMIIIWWHIAEHMILIDMIPIQINILQATTDKIRCNDFMPIQAEEQNVWQNILSK